MTSSRQEKLDMELAEAMSINPIYCFAKLSHACSEAEVGASAIPTPIKAVIAFPPGDAPVCSTRPDSKELKNFADIAKKGGAPVANVSGTISMPNSFSNAGAKPVLIFANMPDVKTPVEKREKGSLQG